MVRKSRTMAAGEFKAKCLAVLDEVEQTGTEVVITKRGREVARLVPPAPRRRPLRPAHFKHLLAGPVGDVVTPLDVEWDAMK
jgi:prevent-host-death family protein